MDLSREKNNFRVRRQFSFDAGHRIANHKGQCRHLHGHRYVMELTLAGALQIDETASDYGMVLDFGEIKSIAHEAIVNPWDHAFLVDCSDTVVVDFLKTLPEHKTIVLDGPPTAEWLAKTAFEILAPRYEKAFQGRLRLESVLLFETPNCAAEYRG
jgi:6-pyruvoyltetrahydropterin/6-carboxytetrahydropterin synthase